MGIGIFRRLDYFLTGRSRLSIRNILIDRTGKQIYVLLHHTDLAAKAL